LFCLKIAAIKFVQDKKELDEAKFNEECGVGMFSLDQRLLV
jgi:hypothetical protein